jgi:hypothetical protein
VGFYVWLVQGRGVDDDLWHSWLLDTRTAADSHRLAVEPGGLGRGLVPLGPAFDVRDQSPDVLFWRVYLDTRLEVHTLSSARQEGRWKSGPEYSDDRHGLLVCGAEIGGGVGDVFVISDEGRGVARIATGLLSDEARDRDL